MWSNIAWEAHLYWFDFASVLMGESPSLWRGVKCWGSREKCEKMAGVRAVLWPCLVELGSCLDLTYGAVTPCLRADCFVCVQARK